MAKVTDISAARRKRAKKKGRPAASPVIISNFIIAPDMAQLSAALKLLAELPSVKLIRQAKEIPASGVFLYLTPEHLEFMRRHHPLIFRSNKDDRTDNT